jgi:hypothetical protein
MAQFDEIFNDIQNSNDYEENARLLQYLGNVLKSNMAKLPAEEKISIKDFALKEMQKLIEVIPSAKNYREKDKMFFYEDSVLMIFTLMGDHNSLTDEQADILQKLIATVSKERVLENSVDKMFELAKIEKADAEAVLSIAKPIKDDYQRGMLFQGLLEHKDKIKNMSADAKSAIAEFTESELERLLSEKDLSDDAVNIIEFAADVSKYFITGKILDMLEKAMSVVDNQIRYFILETLLENNRQVSADAIKEIAGDLSYANLLKNVLVKYGKANLFPKEYDTPEYLAKSDLVHWLCYPTELNQKPNEIELLGKATVKKEDYFIFKYKSDSDNLTDELQNVWLIGWSGSQGSTFSEFDKLSDFEKKTPEKTVKYITKKLLK